MGPDGPVMPQRVIDKPPTAELRPNQKDEDSLPPYESARPDPRGAGRKGNVGEGGRGRDRRRRAPLVADIERKLLRAEYKRRQAPPGVKLGTRNFGRDRRYPITNAFHTS